MVSSGNLSRTSTGGGGGGVQVEEKGDGGSGDGLKASLSILCGEVEWLIGIGELVHE
jgi:hypothetical protein